MALKKIYVKQVKSSISCTDRQINQLKGLGLRRIGHERALENTPAVRGMIKKIIHLVVFREENS